VYISRDEKQLSHIELRASRICTRFVDSLATDGEMDSLKLNPSVSIGYCASVMRPTERPTERRSPRNAIKVKGVCVSRVPLLYCHLQSDLRRL
jgi:hypothetical protein